MERNASEFQTMATSAGLRSIYLCTHCSRSVDSGKEIPDMKLLNIISRFSSWRLEFTLPPLISDLKLLCDSGMDVLTVCGEYDRPIPFRTSHPSGGIKRQSQKRSAWEMHLSSTALGRSKIEQRVDTRLGAGTMGIFGETKHETSLVRQQSTLNSVSRIRI